MLGVDDDRFSQSRLVAFVVMNDERGFCKWTISTRTFETISPATKVPSAIIICAGCRGGATGTILRKNELAHLPTTLSPNLGHPDGRFRLRQVSPLRPNASSLSRRYGTAPQPTGSGHWAAGYRTLAFFWFRLAHLRRFPVRRVGARRAAAGILATAAAGHHRRCADGFLWLRPVAIHRRRDDAETSPRALVGRPGPGHAEVLQTRADTLIEPPAAWRAATTSRRRPRRVSASIHYGPHGRANLADVWRRQNLPAGKAPVLVRSRRRMGFGLAARKPIHL